MSDIKTYSVTDLLSTSTFKYNRSNLAKFLKINRSVLSSYIEDVNCDKHVVLCKDGAYTFMNTTRR